jgi:membrane-bound acyltransferase YfiQ involved in biofilm formation
MKLTEFLERYAWTVSVAIILLFIFLFFVAFGGISFFDNTELATEFTSTLSDSPLSFQSCFPGVCYVYHLDSWGFLGVLLAFFAVAWLVWLYSD